MLLSLGVVFIVFNYDFFVPEYIPAPDERTLSTQCDPKGKRQMRVFTLTDEATGPAIFVGVNAGCGNRKTGPEIIVFAGDARTIHDDDVKATWMHADTLKIIYKTGLSIGVKKDTVTFDDHTLDFVAVYEEMK